MTSLNFYQYPQYPQVDIWGADAERFLFSHPDLALIRLRQLVELLIRILEYQQGTRYIGDLAKKIDLVIQNASLESDIADKLHWVRKKGNNAVHVKTLNPKGARAWLKDARTGIKKTAEAWAVALKNKTFTFRHPPSINIAEEALQHALVTLDKAEDAIEKKRENKEAELLLQQVNVNHLQQQDVKNVDLDLIRIRILSISLAKTNHQGLTAVKIDPKLMQRVISSGDPASIEELIHLQNRLAVSLLDKRLLEEALHKIDEYKEWSSSSAAFLPSEFVNLPIRNWQLGALLGSRGMILMHLGHATFDVEKIREAISCFKEAKDLFLDDVDKNRHHNNHLAALVDLGQMGETLSEQEISLLKQTIQNAPIEQLEEVNWSPLAFQVSLALKAARLLNIQPKWINKLAHIIANFQHKEQLSHPYEQIVGGVLLEIKRPPSILKQKLQATTANPGIPGWIATIYLDAINGTHSPPPAHSVQWWNLYQMGKRSTEKGPLSVLAFNYR